MNRFWSDAAPPPAVADCWGVVAGVTNDGWDGCEGVAWLDDEGGGDAGAWLGTDAACGGCGDTDAMAGRVGVSVVEVGSSTV